MSDLPAFRYTNFDELMKLKIPALRRAAENNIHILNQIALNGPLLPYDIFNNLKEKGIYVRTDYPTVNRRIRGLKKKGYLAEAGKRQIERGKRTKESLYGLTWKGFITILFIKKVRENIIQVLEKNPLLTFPEKDSILPILESIITPEELEIVSRSLLEAYLEVIPNIETIREDQWWIWFFAINRPILFPENFKLSKVPENGWELLDRPSILKVVKQKILPSIRQKSLEITWLYILLRALNELGDFIVKLDEKDKPSKKIKEYLENKWPRLFPDEQIEKGEERIK